MSAADDDREPAGIAARWRTLPVYLIRLAGFSIERLEALRCARAADAADAVEAATSARRDAGHAFIRAVRRELDAPLADPDARAAFVRQCNRAKTFAGRLADEPVPGEVLRAIVASRPEIAEAAAALERAHAAWRAAEQAYAAAFAGDLARARGALRQMYQDARLREAVFLQSTVAFDAIRELAASEGPRNARARKRERLAAMYAQRFCAKNDTNAFCGPVGVGYLTEAAPRDEAEAAPAAIEIAVEDARRQTYFSYWAAQRLLEEAVQRADDRSLVTLRLQPAARVDGDSVAWCVMTHDATMAFRRRYARSALSPGGARLLRALAAPRTLAEVTALAPELELETDETDPPEPSDGLEPFLAQLIDAGVIQRGPVLPPGLFHPLRAVAAEVTRWPASDARAWALAEVAAAEQLVAAFARAPLDDRREIYGRLTAWFEQATGQPASRGEGRHYADRSVLHEDCFVEARCELGAARAVVQRALPTLISVLELPLELSRERVRQWFRVRFGEGVRVPALEVHRAFDGDRVLEERAATPRAAALDAAIDRVRGAIERAVAASPAGPVRLEVGELREALGDVPPPAHAGYVSTDLMMRRLPSGGTGLVLAEVHGFFWLPTNRLDILPPEDRERALDQMRAAVRELAHGRRTAEAVFLHTQATDRRFPLATADLELLVRSGRPEALDFGALDLRLAGDDFEFLHGDEEIVPLVAYARYPFLLYTSRVAPLYDDYAERFFPETMLPPALRGGDAPRLAVDDLVFRRRTWRRPAAAVRDLLSGQEPELFRRAQALRRDLGCDSRVFASLPGEPKPVLLDFDNVFLLEALRNMLERQPDDAMLKLTEMLPGPGELVARGPDGPRTSELRMGFYRVAAAPGSGQGSGQGSGSTAAIRNSAV